jgi:hypothetical protein
VPDSSEDPGDQQVKNIARSPHRTPSKRPTQSLLRLRNIEHAGGDRSRPRLAPASGGNRRRRDQALGRRADLPEWWNGGSLKLALLCTMAAAVLFQPAQASDSSSPPCLLRSLPAGAVAGWGLHPLEKRRLVTAHVESGHSHRILRELSRLCSYSPAGRSRRKLCASVPGGCRKRSRAAEPPLDIEQKQGFRQHPCDKLMLTPDRKATTGIGEPQGRVDGIGAVNDQCSG